MHAEAVQAGADPRLARLLLRDSTDAWIARAAAAESAHELGRVLIDAALRNELDPLIDPATRSMLGLPGLPASDSP